MRAPSILLFAATLTSAAKVVLDDFNDPYKGQTLQGWHLGAAAKAGFWYGYNDWNHGKAGLGTAMIPDVVNEDTGFDTAIADDCGEGSPCLHVKFIGGTGYAYPFSGIGFNFLQEGTDIDLTTMDSITFRAKGSGSFRFKLMTKRITDDLDRKNYWADMGTTFELSEEWETYRVGLKNIKPQEGAPLAAKLTWQDCRDQTRKIHITTSPSFMAQDILDLWIDDIVMHGVTPAVFGGTWNEDSTSGVGSARSTQSPAIARSGSRLTWNPDLVRRIDFLDIRGRLVGSRSGEDGSIPLEALPAGTLLAKASLADGRGWTTKFVISR